MKSFYNRFHSFYWLIERFLGASLLRIAREKIKQIHRASDKSAIDYGCGTGLLTIELASNFKHVEGRDISMRMIEKAREHAEKTGTNSSFSYGNILEPLEQPKSFDYVFASFVLHLFPPPALPGLISNLLSIAREGVVIIDHKQQWKPFMAFAEWIEGSYYDEYINVDFKDIAAGAGASRYEETEIVDCNVMSFFPAISS